MGDRIKRLRTDKGWTQEELGNRVGLKRAAINKYEKGNVENMKRSIVEKMSSLFDVSPSYLMALEQNEPIIDSSITTIYNKLEPPRQKVVYETAEIQLNEQQLEEQENENVVTIPTVHHNVAANPAAINYGDIEIEDETYFDCCVPKNADYAISIKGDSMSPKIKHGSIIFYREQPNVEEGEIAIVEIDGDSVTCKQVFFDLDNELVILHSLNSKYEDREVEPERVRIIGKVVN